MEVKHDTPTPLQGQEKEEPLKSRKDWIRLFFWANG